MTPIEFDTTVTKMNPKMLRNKINYCSYSFCVNADFTKTDAMTHLIEKLELYVLEGLLRALEKEIGYRPYQNKIYELVEKVFGDQDAYNINRMMSSIRRTKMVPIDPENTKYIKWMKNRVKYGVRPIMDSLHKELLPN